MCSADRAARPVSRPTAREMLWQMRLETPLMNIYFSEQSSPCRVAASESGTYRIGSEVSVRRLRFDTTHISRRQSLP
jgi:hypothetical protein